MLIDYYWSTSQMSTSLHFSSSPWSSLPPHKVSAVLASLRKKESGDQQLALADIAVDGWALTLLSQENLSYASTAQTVGLNTGYFMSFTVFLAFNSVDFW